MNWRDTLAEKRPAPGFQVSHPTLNFGHIHGGDNPNRICAQCELHIDLRLVPGMTVRPPAGHCAPGCESVLATVG